MSAHARTHHVWDLCIHARQRGTQTDGLVRDLGTFQPTHTYTQSVTNCRLARGHVSTEAVSLSRVECLNIIRMHHGINREEMLFCYKIVNECK